MIQPRSSRPRPLATKAQLAEYRAMLSTVRDRMLVLIKKGKKRSRHLRRQALCRLRHQVQINDQAVTNWMRVCTRA
jgi:hypothetical protein